MLTLKDFHGESLRNMGWEFAGTGDRIEALKRTIEDSPDAFVGMLTAIDVDDAREHRIILGAKGRPSKVLLSRVHYHLVAPGLLFENRSSRPLHRFRSGRNQTEAA